jgi:hypothetical protein
MHAWALKGLSQDMDVIEDLPNSLFLSVFRTMILKCQAALLLKENISKVFACFYKKTY